MSQSNIVRGVETKVSTTEGTTRVTYRGTTVVEFNADRIILNTGGWKTVTTKLRMTQAANQFDLGYWVFQRKGEWFIVLGEPGGPYPADATEHPFVGDVFTIDRLNRSPWGEMSA